MAQSARASLWECVVLSVAGSIPARTLNFYQYISPGTVSVRALILSILSPHRPSPCKRVGQGERGLLRFTKIYLSRH